MDSSKKYIHMGMCCCVDDGAQFSFTINDNFSYEIYIRIKWRKFTNLYVLYFYVDLFVSKWCLTLKLFLICKFGRPGMNVLYLLYVFFPTSKLY